MIAPGKVALLARTAAFAPSDYANLAHWIDASDASTLTLSGSRIDQWQDKSGRGLTMVSDASVALRPSISYAVMLGLPAATFNGAQYITWPFIFTTIPAAAEIFAVVKRIDMPTGYPGSGLWDHQANANNAHYPAPPSDNSGAILENFASSTRRAIPPTGLTLTNTHVINLFSASNDWGMNIDGVSFATDASNVLDYYNSSGSANAAHLGRNLAGNYFNGYVGEVIIYGRKLTTTERNAITSYLTLKWITGVPGAAFALAFEDATTMLDLENSLSVLGSET